MFIKVGTRALLLKLVILKMIDTRQQIVDTQTSCVNGWPDINHFNFYVIL